MKRRSALKALASLFAACAAATRAQQPTKIATVGVPLIAAGPKDAILEQLRHGLRDLGYVDGENIRIEYRSTEGKVERLPAVLRELVQAKVDVIVAGAAPIVAAAKQATSTIPIVLVGYDYDPVAAGFVSSLSKPGGNVTGVYLRVEETVGKRLEVMKELLPGLSRIGVLHDSFAARQFAQVGPAAKALGLQVLPIEVAPPYDFHAVFKKAKMQKVAAVAVLFSPHFYVNRQRLFEAALAQRLPMMAIDSSAVYAGALIAYGPDPKSGWRRAGYFIDRILHGVPPNEIPVEQSDVYQLLVNMKTAKALGIAIPESILRRADEVVR